MIPNLASPSVCVIDDDETEYTPILEALHRMGLGCIHVRGDVKRHLPKKPYKSLRVVFADLHLTTQVGKSAASHTANVFSKVVSTETAPMVVVIWSKYKDDVLSDVPGDEEPTEADLFKSTLLEAFPAFSERLVFIEMKKPKFVDRPSTAKWVTKLKREIKEKLESVSAFNALWAWEALVRDAGIDVTEGLTSLAMLEDTHSEISSTLPERLKLALRLLVSEQGGHQCSPASAPRHLSAVLAQLLIDHLEHTDERKDLIRHGPWLSNQDGLPKTSVISPGINSFLLTSELSKKSKPFVPGTIYRLTNVKKFEEIFGMTSDDLLSDCHNGSEKKFTEWKQKYPPKIILVEISPVCDVHQSKRQNALLIGGLIFPAEAKKELKRADAIEVLDKFSLRWPVDDFESQTAFLAFFSRLKTTMRATREPKWLAPWFRLRDLPTASLRNWHASHAARVGYVSLK